jgi:hypothetical protein
LSHCCFHMAVLTASLLMVGCGSNVDSASTAVSIAPISGGKDGGKAGPANPSTSASSSDAAGVSAPPVVEVYDLARDFSADKNPNGPWTIGVFNHVFSGVPNELQNLTTYGKLEFTPTADRCGGGELFGWGKLSAGFLGVSSASGVVKNASKSTQYTIPAGCVGIFPEGGPIAVRWTAPKSGNVNVRATFEDLDPGYDAGVPEVWVLVNQNVVHYQSAYVRNNKDNNNFRPAIWYTNNKSTKKSNYQAAISLRAKDTVDFVVDPMYTFYVGRSEHPEGDATGIIRLTAVINYTTGGGVGK